MEVMTCEHALEDSGYQLSNDERTLYLPGPSFIVLLFTAARKPHAYLPLIRGYMNAAYHDPKATHILFKVVDLGL